MTGWRGFIDWLAILVGGQLRVVFARRCPSLSGFPPVHRRHGV